MLFRNTEIEGLNIFYREAGERMAPKLLLLHGFPTSSHQYRNLMPALAERFHVIAPDYPGFGNSDMPDPKTFPYTFDKTSEIIESFLKKIGFTRFGLYLQDYGGPVGFRIPAVSRPSQPRHDCCDHDAGGSDVPGKRYAFDLGTEAEAALAAGSGDGSPCRRNDVGA